jgi:hypothetical protein
MKPFALLISVLLLPHIALCQPVACEAGAPCTVQGVLRIFETPPVPTAILELEGTCVPLALPSEVFADAKRWAGKFVTIVGSAHSHGVADGVVSYQLEGRNVTGSVCRGSPIALFVNEIQVQQ